MDDTVDGGVVSDAFASVPFTGPAPDVEPRCWRCATMIARVVARPWVIDCHRCKARNQRGVPDGVTAEDYGATPRSVGARQASRHHAARR